MKKILYFLFFIIINIYPFTVHAELKGDIDNNGKIGIEEAIYALRVVANLPTGEKPADDSTARKLKIFVTKVAHVGDFENDPLLPGANAIEKADSFCNQDLNKPDSNIYKALLVDDATRSAVNNTNWVLLANTTYYRPSGLEIGTTTGAAIFPSLYQDLTNSFDDVPSNIDDLSNLAWTGITDSSNFSSNGKNCYNWSSASSGVAGVGALGLKDGNAFFFFYMSCSSPKLKLICVEQQ